MTLFSPASLPGFALIQGIGKALSAFSWLWLVLLLGYVLLQVIKRWRQNVYLQKNHMVLLEIRVPRETIRGPKAMEQFLASINGLVNAPDDFIERYIDGEVPLWFSLEIASFGGDIHFYIGTPKRHANMVEAHLYAQYPDAEVTLVDDYTDRLPSNIPELFDAGYNLYGTELLLGEDDAYPIRSYTEFESSEDAQNIDPISSLIENIAKAKSEEHLWLQIVIRPTQPNWRAKGEKVIEKLKENAMTKKQIVRDGVTQEQTIQSRLTPGELEIMEAIEANIAKPVFDTVIRYIYFAPQKAFNMNFGKRAIFSSLQQYKSENLNYFTNNYRVRTLANWSRWPHIFPKRRRNSLKANVLFSYRTRHIPDAVGYKNPLFGRPTKSKYSVMNTESLATIYHIPNSTVLIAPFIKRVESRRIGPPAGLPIFSEGGEGATGFQFGPPQAKPNLPRE